MLEIASASVASFITLLLSIRLLWPKKKDQCFQIAFLHPFANAGGGGERVLWMAISAVQKAFPTAIVTIYTAKDGSTDGEIQEKAQKTFGVSFERPIKLCTLWTAPLLNPKLFPIFTMAFQALAMILVGFECLLRMKPHLLIDTMGVPFAYPLFWLANVPTVAYVHYPFICKDVIKKKGTGNSASFVSLLWPLKWLRTIYQLALLRSYSFVGKCLSDVMVNSSWTMDRINHLWGIKNYHHRIIYPPCDLTKLSSFKLDEEREPIIFSLGQFRPEKNHTMQIHILKRLFELRPEWRGKVQLLICGGCRNREDEDRVEALFDLAIDLEIDDSIQIVTNVDFDYICDTLKIATVGLHTMVDEHFGINIVEFMAGGPIAVANNSGGPKTDIIRSDEEGFLCATIEEYALTLEKILSMPETSRKSIRENARVSALSRFDSSVFDKKFVSCLAEIIRPLGKPDDIIAAAGNE